MQVLPCLLVEQFHQVFAGVHDLLLLLARQRPHLIQNLVVVFGAPHVGHLSSVQDVVQVLEEAFFHDLCV